MISSEVVDLLGMLAGAIWMYGAIHFQLVRTRTVHPAIVTVLFLVGVALMLLSSALALSGRTLVVVLAAAGNTLFLVLGIGVWYLLERHADYVEAQCRTNEFGTDRA